MPLEDARKMVSGTARDADRAANDVPQPKPLILVVEDDPDTAELIANVLRHYGCEVLVRRDGESALETARELPAPDLALVDLELPGMNGRDLLAAMKGDVTLSGIPVVVVSGAPDAHHVYATDHIEKHELLDGLARVVRRLRGATSAAATTR